MEINTALLQMAVAVVRPQIQSFLTDGPNADELESRISEIYTGVLTTNNVIGGTILEMNDGEIVSTTVTTEDIGGLSAALTMDLLRALVNE